MTPRLKAYDHPAAWKGSGVQGKDEFAVDLADKHIDAFAHAVKKLKTDGKTEFHDIGRHDFNLEGIAGDLTDWQHEIVDGKGLLILRGFPVDAFSTEEIELMWLGLGTHFGRPVSQSAMGELLGHVVNVGGQDARERAYRNSRSLRLHTDRCDTVGMFALQPAETGGLSSYCSALAIYNEMLRTRPDLIEPLWKGFHLHKFGEEMPGEPPYSKVPVPIISEKDDLPTVILMRGYIDMAVEEFGLPFSDQDREAMDMFEEIGARPEFKLDFILERGEATLFNNSRILHRRTAFQDSEIPAKKRHLMRLWLNDWDGRVAVDAVSIHKGDDGIPHQDGKSTYYANRNVQVSG